MTGAVSILVITIGGIRIRVGIRISEIRLRVTVRIVLARIARITVVVTPIVRRPTLIDHVRSWLIHHDPAARARSHHDKTLTESDRSHHGQNQSANRCLKNS